MADKLKSTLMFALADVLGTTLIYDDKTKKLAGSTSRDVMFGDLPVTFDLKVVSNWLLEGEYMLLAKVMGNLSLFVASYRTAKDEVVELHLLNQARIDSPISLLEKLKPADVHAAVGMLKPAIVKSFIKKTKNKWEQAA